VSYSIRRMTVQDTDAYKELRLESLQRHPEAFAATYENALQRPEGYWTELLARLTFFAAFADDGQPMGLVAFDQSEGDKDRHRGWLLQMYVRPEMRGTGCAQALVETLLEYAQGKVLQVHLGVWSENHAAIRLYQKTGFVTYATDPRAFYVNGRFIDDHLMVRFLDEAPGKTDQ
jgi:RimJ/RimL family protein N-acetyltransferase